jgi:hypothetical protein
MIIYPSEYWFRVDKLRCRVGLVRRWVYDRWYEVVDRVTNEIYYVEPQDIVEKI